MKLTYQKYTFHIRAIDELNLPRYKGSTFRGGFGNAFKKIACVLKTLECNSCPLKDQCLYIYIFETTTPTKSSILNMYPHDKVPHPFVIEPPATEQTLFNEDEILTFNLILIGKAIQHFPYFLYAFDRLGQIGIGKGRGRFKVERVVSNEVTVYENEIFIKTEPTVIEVMGNESFNNDISEIKLKILTPLRIKFERKLVDKLEFHILMRNLLRRLSLLCYFHCEQNVDINAKELVEKAMQVKTKNSSLRWLDWERYSNRQQERMKLGGVVGEIVFEGKLSSFLPILKAGEIVHAGKNTAFGLGRYEVEY
ncbi:CRISPR system precrRNA processing endoribonuclease RAMP protein Cas6 [Thermodesulfovibrio hydrogeniphilus]